MADPAPTQILDEIATRLANITIANGYYTNIKKIERARLEPFKGYDLPCINYWCTSLDNERNVYDDDNRSLNLYIEIHDLTRDDPFMDVADKLASDVVTALNRADGSPKVSDDADYELGETVSDMVFSGYEYEIGSGQKPWCGALVRFNIKYRCDPYVMNAYGA